MVCSCAALAEKQRAQESHEEAVLELAKVRLAYFLGARHGGMASLGADMMSSRVKACLLYHVDCEGIAASESWRANRSFSVPLLPRRRSSWRSWQRRARKQTWTHLSKRPAATEAFALVPLGC